MAGSTEREGAIAAVALCGWSVARSTARGYLILRCSCGRHQETLHKTASNPNHFRLKAARMIRICCPGVP